ncbi:PEPxxWA-CTERM sorting domain-containing protein [Sphingomonas sp. PAMC 26617]|uniref:PEPxxWA-CTERM sorting domain-containing protein n=1 Tax=Sphingomonas sp. PAMC 26617 TaxID=1112216 RepID=UPI0009DB6B68|nr:PEPxxWA-CTERM sorting domain-containing protein [Sphingomonas sp. PAMC 26617]
MKSRLATIAAASVIALCAAAPASAAVTVLTFEGIADSTAVGNFYAPNYTFSASTLALVDSDAGGNGNFANEPSGNTIFFFTGAEIPILNVTNGFDTGFSFFYTSATAATVRVFSGFNGTGTLLGTIDLSAQFTQNCGGDPTGDFCNFTNAGVAFAGTAHSIDFGGTASQTGYDDITFGSDVAGGAVPEPATWAMMLAGFGMIGCTVRRRQQVRTTVAYA